MHDFFHLISHLGFIDTSKNNHLLVGDMHFLMFSVILKFENIYRKTNMHKTIKQKFINSLIGIGIGISVNDVNDVIVACK